MPLRFRDYNTGLWEFELAVWVKCPRCDRPVLSRCLDQRRTWRMACPHCSYTQTASRQGNRRKPLPWWTGDWWTEYRKFGGAVDPVFGLPLWLQVPCCGKVLWAYNEAHLDLLDAYISASLRERQGSLGNHHSIAVRLPRWMKLAHHRPPLIKGIQQLRRQIQRDRLSVSPPIAPDR